MRFSRLGVCLFAFIALMASKSSGDFITLTPSDIHGGDTTTTSFSNEFVTLTPTVGGVTSVGGTPVTFNANAARLGIDIAGTSNSNAFNDPDTTAGNTNDEGLILEFKGNAGFRGISWDFSRADGPLSTDGVQFSGFAFDPVAVLSGNVIGGQGNPIVTTSFDSGVLTLQLNNFAFVGADGFLTFENTAASAGRAITLSVADSTQVGAQFAVTSITYDTTAVPELSSITLVAFAGMGMAVRRRRRRR